MSWKSPTICDTCGMPGTKRKTIRALAPLGTGRRARLCRNCQENALREELGMPDEMPWPNCGGVYFIQPYEDHHGLIKIGSSDCISARIEGIRNQCPVRLRLLGYIDEYDFNDVSSIVIFERSLHQQFQLYRQYGEWFQPNLELLSYIHALRFTAIGVECVV